MWSLECAGCVWRLPASQSFSFSWFETSVSFFQMPVLPGSRVVGDLVCISGSLVLISGNLICLEGDQYFIKQWVSIITSNVAVICYILDPITQCLTHPIFSAIVCPLRRCNTDILNLGVSNQLPPAHANHESFGDYCDNGHHHQQ
jgi:hypothetical protein